MESATMMAIEDLRLNFRRSARCQRQRMKILAPSPTQEGRWTIMQRSPDDSAFRLARRSCRDSPCDKLRPAARLEFPHTWRPSGDAVALPEILIWGFL